jgi:hypothetical protein
VVVTAAWNEDPFIVVAKSKWCAACSTVVVVLFRVNVGEKTSQRALAMLTSPQQLPVVH